MSSKEKFNLIKTMLLFAMAFLRTPHTICWKSRDNYVDL